MLDEQGCIALEAVCCELGSNPESYEQSAWGRGGKPDCNSPECIAGHIVYTTTKGQDAYARKLCMIEGVPTSTDVQNAIRDAATETLGLSAVPRLFEPEWPKQWLEQGGGIPEHPGFWQIEPSADEAVIVLQTIIDGELDEALDPSLTLQRSAGDDEAGQPATACHDASGTTKRQAVSRQEPPRRRCGDPRMRAVLVIKTDGGAQALDCSLIPPQGRVPASAR